MSEAARHAAPPLKSTHPPTFSARAAPCVIFTTLLASFFEEIQQIFLPAKLVL